MRRAHIPNHCQCSWTAAVSTDVIQPATHCTCEFPSSLLFKMQDYCALWEPPACHQVGCTVAERCKLVSQNVKPLYKVWNKFTFQKTFEQNTKQFHKVWRNFKIPENIKKKTLTKFKTNLHFIKHSNKRQNTFTCTKFASGKTNCTVQTDRTQNQTALIGSHIHRKKGLGGSSSRFNNDSKSKSPVPFYRFCSKPEFETSLPGMLCFVNLLRYL